MALIFLYRPLEEGDTFDENQIRATRNASDIQFIERICKPGEFSFRLPIDDPICADLQADYIVGIDKYYGIIKAIGQYQASNNQYVQVSGTDLKGYLQDRITLYPEAPIKNGLQGYDAINNAPTETVIKHFIKNNVTEPTDPNRKIPGFWIAPDLERGIDDDRYMSRFETLSDVCEKNCTPAKMGYTVTVDLANDRYVFDVFEGVNRTADQTENPVVIFDIKLRNFISCEYNDSRREYKNAFYSTMSGSQNDVESLTALYFRSSEGEQAGAARKEQHLNVSVNIPTTDFYNTLKSYALKDAESYLQSQNLSVETTEKYCYGVDYSLGDFVTIQLRSGIWGNQIAVLNMQIVEVIHTWIEEGIRHTIGFGQERLTYFDIIKRDIKNGGI